ncbi:MAG: 16S rRNA (adenine(1518)-N(6)/adenine(1519)-N(6))-dimethyltransferase RsmA [Clostridia bacterium]|nr:16S rRNA (adenine(1518)-N(6)/adenine(1519)-N(6))-dimethyltransferase RsmA [Clostridia bacterium]
MNHISSIADIKKIMSENNLVFHKGLGQNFLFDEHYLNAIVESGDITKEDVVIEIGPGLGVMTTRLAEKAKKVIAIEIDNNIVPVLKNITAPFGNVEIICADIMKTDVNSLIADEEHIKVVANLPYYITTPIIMKLLEEKINAECIVVMIQKEVAERLVAKAGSKDYGAITLAIDYYTDSKIMFNVPAGAFVPAPKVESAVVKMDIRHLPAVKVNDVSFMFSIIKAAFGQRRKTFVNAVNSYLKIDKATIIEALITCGYDERVRGEVLSLQDFAKLSDFLQK